MIPNPIHKVLSIFQSCEVRALLMGGQACVFYGGAEFSRDTDFAILAEADNLQRLNLAMSQLQAARSWSNCGVAPDRHSREAVALTPLPGSGVEVPLAGGATDLHAQHGPGEVEGEVAPKRRHPVDEQPVVQSPAPGAPAEDGVRILHEQDEADGQAKGQPVGNATLPDGKAQKGRHQQRQRAEQDRQHEREDAQQGGDGGGHEWTWTGSKV